MDQKRARKKITNSGRNRVNIFGAISIEDLDVVTRSYNTINQFNVCDFLIALREKLYLILDQGPSNKAFSVRAWAKLKNIKIIFLPACSPNLNPIERLWKFFKKKVLYGKYYEKLKDFEFACGSFFKNIKKYKLNLETLITDNFQLYTVVSSLSHCFI